MGVIPDEGNLKEVLKKDNFMRKVYESELGEDFQILGSKIEYHQTPFDTSQQFLYCWFKIK